MAMRWTQLWVKDLTVTSLMKVSRTHWFEALFLKVVAHNVTGGVWVVSREHTGELLLQFLLRELQLVFRWD